MPDLVREVLKKWKDRDKPEFLLNVALANANINLTWLIDAIGMDATMKLILVYGGETIHIPKAKAIVDCLNIAGAALEVHRDSLTAHEAGRKYKVNTTAVKKVLRVLDQMDTTLNTARRLAKSELLKRIDK